MITRETSPLTRRLTKLDPLPLNRTARRDTQEIQFFGSSELSEERIQVSSNFDDFNSYKS